MGHWTHSYKRNKKDDESKKNKNKAEPGFEIVAKTKGWESKVDSLNNK